MRWATNPWRSGHSTSSRPNDCFTPSFFLPSASETASRAEHINRVTLVSPSMTHQSGLLLLRAQDASVAIAFASRFALVCIANFAFGFGAGYLYAQYRNICTSEEEGNHAASKSDNTTGTVTQEVTAESQQHSATTVSDSVVEEQHDSLEQASRKFMESPQCETEPKSPPGTPMRTDDKPFTTRRVLAAPGVESHAPENPNQELQHELEQLNASVAKEEESITSGCETNKLGLATVEEQGNVNITDLQVQPIHGCPPQSVTSIRLNQDGVENHLMYAVSDFTGRYISNEKVPSLLEITPTILENGHLRLSAPGLSPAIHEPKFWGRKKNITIHGVQYEAVDQGDSVSQFFASYLEIPGVRLLLLRPPPLSNGGHQLFRTWPTADRPLLLISEESKSSAENNHSTPMGTNIVISASESDILSSTAIKIGDHLFEVMKVRGEGSHENIPSHHLLGGGMTLVPVNFGRNEFVLNCDQTIVMIKPGPEECA